MPTVLTIDLETVPKQTAAVLAAAFGAIADGTVPSTASASEPAKPASDIEAPAPGSAAPASATPAADPAAALTARFFPDNIGLAAFPSPENSSVVRLGALISGRPYLRDDAGNVHQFVSVSDAVPNGYLMNGQTVQGGGSDHSPAASLLVRQGKVFVNVGGNIWQTIHNGGLYTASLPAAFQTDGSGATTSTVATSSVKAPDMPAPMTPAPGTTGQVLEVGPGKPFTTITAAIKAAVAGELIAVDAGTYAEAPPAWTVPLHLKAVGGKVVIDCTGLTGSLARGKGALVPCADSIIEGFRVTGVAMDQVGAQLTSGVRPDGGCGYLTLRDVELDHNQSGLGTGGDLAIKIVVDGGSFHDNGLPAGVDGNGYTHNIYTGAGTSLTLQGGFSSTTPNGGHAVKHRGWAFSSTGGKFDATDAAVFDLPQGSVGVAVIDGASITKPAGSANHTLIDYASENNDSGNGGLVIKNSTITADCDNPVFIAGEASVITIDPSTKMFGTKPKVDRGTVKGL